MQFSQDRHAVDRVTSELGSFFRFVKGLGMKIRKLWVRWVTAPLVLGALGLGYPRISTFGR